MQQDQQSCELDFVITADVSMANALRRTMLGDIQSAVIDDVVFAENDSKMCEEMIASRLGLVPLVCAAARQTQAAEAVAAAEVTLDAVGPGTVYSRDIRFSADFPVSVADPDIPLVRLGDGAKLRLRGSLSVGTARTHAKYDVCCGTTYRQLEQGKYQFHVETSGAMTAAQVVSAALDALESRLGKYRGRR